MTTDVAIRTHLATVARTQQITPGVRRITFAGDDIDTYRPLAPDQFLYLLLPPPGRNTLTVGRDFDWISYHLMPEEDRPVGAHYTVRHHRPDRGEIDVDFVLHAAPGPASGWAQRAEPGDPVALWGPRTAYDPPLDVDWFLLVADETGWPATAAILENLAATGFGGPVHALVEVADHREEQPLPALEALPTAWLTWLHRGRRAAGTTTQLANAVRALELPAGAPYVWGGGESRAMTGVRRYLRHEVGLPRERVSLTPYWRHAAHADDPDEPDSED
jgi:NADPH-dependent ferric siderophore reductase